MAASPTHEKLRKVKNYLELGMCNEEEARKARAEILGNIGRPAGPLLSVPDPDAAGGGADRGAIGAAGPGAGAAADAATPGSGGGAFDGAFVESTLTSAMKNKYEPRRTTLVNVNSTSFAGPSGRSPHANASLLVRHPVQLPSSFRASSTVQQFTTTSTALETHVPYERGRDRDGAAEENGPNVTIVTTAIADVTYPEVLSQLGAGVGGFWRLALKISPARPDGLVDSDTLASISVSDVVIAWPDPSRSLRDMACHAVAEYFRSWLQLPSSDDDGEMALDQEEDELEVLGGKTIPPNPVHDPDAAAADDDGEEEEDDEEGGAQCDDDGSCSTVVIFFAVSKEKITDDETETLAEITTAARLKKVQTFIMPLDKAIERSDKASGIVMMNSALEELLEARGACDDAVVITTQTTPLLLSTHTAIISACH